MNGPLLAVDTATRRACLAIGDGRARPLAQRGWDARQRHAETLLDELDALLAEARLRPADLGAIVAGIGPGAFTGLRVGLATAKTLAHGLGLPICGLATTAALALGAARADAAEGTGPAAASHLTVLLPAGPNGVYVARYLITLAAPGRSGPEVVVQAIEPPRLAGPSDVAVVAAEADPEAAVVAVDLESSTADPAGVGGLQFSSAALERGRRAALGLGDALLTLGAARLAMGEPDDVAALVPSYVSLPRGAPAGGEAWSPDLR